MSVRRALTLLLPLLLHRGAGAETPQDQFQAAMQLARAGRLAESEQILRTLERSHAKEFEIRYRLGLVLLKLAKHADAVERFEAAAAIRPDLPAAWVALARAKLQVGSRASALKAAHEAARLAAEPEIFRALAMFYVEAEDFGNAAEFEERWSRATPQDAEARPRAAAYHVRAADTHRKANSPGKAVEAYQHAIRLAPDEQQAYYKLATLFLDHRTPEPALSVLNVAASKFRNEAEYHRLLGLAWYQLGQMQKAIDAFLSACDLAPDSEVGYASLETLLGDAGPRLTEIAARLRSFRQRRPDSPVGHFLLAKALQIQGAPASEVEGLLATALQAEPRFWPAHYEMGQLLANQSKWTAATAALTRAVEVNDKYAPAHYALARVYAETGDRLRARSHRKMHHELLRKQREAAEQQRAAAPALVYRMDSPNP